MTKTIHTGMSTINNTIISWSTPKLSCHLWKIQVKMERQAHQEIEDQLDQQVAPESVTGAFSRL